MVGRAPLAARLRPNTLDEIIGQQHLVVPGAPLRALVESDRLTSAILWGLRAPARPPWPRWWPPTTAEHFVPSPPSPPGSDVREVVEGARRRSGSRGRGPSSSSTRSTGSTGPSRTPCCPRWRKG